MNKQRYIPDILEDILKELKKLNKQEKAPKDPKPEKKIEKRPLPETN